LAACLLFASLPPRAVGPPSNVDVVIESVIVEAVALAKHNTIMKVDVVAAINKYLKKTDLTWDQTAASVIKHNPTDSGRSPRPASLSGYRPGRTWTSTRSRASCPPNPPNSVGG